MESNNTIFREILKEEAMSLHHDAMVLGYDLCLQMLKRMVDITPESNEMKVAYDVLCKSKLDIIPSLLKNNKIDK